MGGKNTNHQMKNLLTQIFMMNYKYFAPLSYFTILFPRNIYVNKNQKKI